VGCPTKFPGWDVLPNFQGGMSYQISRVGCPTKFPGWDVLPNIQGGMSYQISRAWGLRVD